MAEDRPLNDAAAELAALRQEHEDFKSTVLARLPTMPTGTMLPTLATTPPPGTLLLHGQTVSRTTYARLWQWVQDTSAGGFGVGDGSTTFVLPDTRGKVLRGAAAGETVGQAIGSDTRTLTTANLPAHNHSAAVAAHAQHDHNNSVSVLSNHAGHNAGSRTVASALAGSQDFFFSVANTTQEGAGGHNHSVDVFLGGPTTHTVTEQPVGSGTGVDIRQAGLAVNHLIWT